MKPPRIGQLHHRVSVKTWRDAPSGAAGVTPVFSDVGDVWALIEPVGDVIMQGSINVGEKLTHRIYFRHRSDLTTRHMVEHDGQRYRIIRVTALSGERRFTIASAVLWGDSAEGAHAAPDADFWS